MTYLGMTLPMAVWSTITWIENPSENNGNEVQIQSLSKKHIVALCISGIIVTAVFYYILKSFNTPNIIFSTISIITSFIAASLTMLRSSYYAVWYAANDVVLIILWVLASLKDPGYIPVVVNFSIFFMNDTRFTPFFIAGNSIFQNPLHTIITKLFFILIFSNFRLL